VPVLPNENHERYSRLRAILIPPRAAAKSIGLKPTSGVATKLERNKAIQARIAELVMVDEEILREKRQQIEAALSAIAYGDGSDFLGKRVTLDWPHRLGALTQLRDMHGFKSAGKIEHTGKDGGAIEVANYTDADRAKALQALLIKTRQRAENA
jgi:hypothetical protein